MVANNIEQLKLWISEYVSKFEEKDMHNQSSEYASLITAIEFAESEESLNMLTHLIKNFKQVMFR